MQSWLASLFNIIYWVMIFFAVLFAFLFCFNVSQIDSFERNATPLVQKMTKPDMSQSSTSQDRINKDCMEKLQELSDQHHYGMKNGDSLYKVELNQFKYHSANGYKPWTSNTPVNYGTPVSYTIQQHIPIIDLGSMLTPRIYDSQTITVTTSTQANYDNKNTPNNNNFSEQ